MKKTYKKPQVLVVKLPVMPLMFNASTGEGGGKKGDLGSSTEILARRSRFSTWEADSNDE